MLAACRQRLSPAFVTALQGSPVTASGLRAEVGAIACDAARLGALAPARTFVSAAGRVPRATRGDPRALLAPFRRHLRVSAPAAAWKRTPEGYVRVPRDAEAKTARRNRGGARAAARGGTSEEGPSSMKRVDGVSAPPYGGRRQNENETHPHERRGKPGVHPGAGARHGRQRHEPVRVALHGLAADSASTSARGSSDSPSSTGSTSGV
jgi:hypothetical protein